MGEFDVLFNGSAIDSEKKKKGRTISTKSLKVMSTRIVAFRNSRFGTQCTRSRHQDSLGAAFHMQNLKLFNAARLAPLRNHDDECLERDMLFNDRWRSLEREREREGEGGREGRRVRRSGSSL